MIVPRKTGDIGEEIAAAYLEVRGFRIVERNYLKKWGEIDIIGEKDGVLHFVEVKTISRLPAQAGENISSTEIARADTYNPAENMHPQKIKRLHRALQSYLLENGREEEWQLDLVVVELFKKDNKAVCELLSNVL